MASIFKMKQPASGFGGNWREGTPLGNGFHGALMYGRIRKEKITLSHTELWRFGVHQAIPDVSDVLPEMRKKILSGNAPQADGMLLDALRKRGYNPGGTKIIPAADINIEYPTDKVFKHYSREIDMDKAEGKVSFELDGEIHTRRAFVSRKDDVVVIECDKDSIIDISIHEPDIPWYRPDDVHVKDPTVITDGEWTYFKAYADGVEHGAVMRVVKKDTALITVKLYCEGTSETKWAELKNHIEALPADYDTLLNRHIPLHKELMDRCKFELDDGDESLKSLSNEELLDIAYDDELPNALTKRMWDYGRYLFISSTAEGSNPCMLTGLWCPEYDAMWAINMANINIEMIYWHCMVGGLDELMHTMFNYYSSAMDEMHENARQIYGCRGIYLPAVSVPTQLRQTCMAPHIINWTAGAGWIAQHYFDYYLFTKDEDFLKNTAYPFMKEAALFYIDFLMWDKDSWHVCPSISPENRTLNYRNEGIIYPDTVQTSIDATMDVAVVKELMSNLLKIADMTDLVPEEDAAEYRRILEHAPEYQVNEKGAPKEWLHDDFPDNDEHRHQSHLYPMFPGFEKVRIDDETDKLYRQGGLNRMSTGAYHQTSWSLIQNANMMARTRDGETAYKSLNIIAKSCIMSNLFTNHNDWRGGGLSLELRAAPFQMDANIGWPSAVMEMLLFSYIGRMDILPALPKKWAKGSIKGLRTRVGTAVDIEWANGSCVADIKALRDTEFDLYMPDGSMEHIKLNKNETVQRTAIIK